MPSYELQNPHFLPGNISGLASVEGDSPGKRVIDTRFGIRITGTDACVVQHPEPGEFVLAYAMAGTVGQTAETVRAMFLITPERAAQMMGELGMFLAQRSPHFAADALAQLREMVSPPPGPDMRSTPHEPRRAAPPPLVAPQYNQQPPVFTDPAPTQTLALPQYDQPVSQPPAEPADRNGPPVPPRVDTLVAMAKEAQGSGAEDRSAA